MSKPFKMKYQGKGGNPIKGDFKKSSPLTSHNEMMDSQRQSFKNVYGTLDNPAQSAQNMLNDPAYRDEWIAKFERWEEYDAESALYHTREGSPTIAPMQDITLDRSFDMGRWIK